MRPPMSAEPNSVNELILDAMNVAARLDALARRDYREITLLALERAENDYAALVRRRDSLSVSTGDNAVLDRLLDSVRARLRFYQNRR